MKIVYMGTPDFAVNPLHALAEAGYEVTGVVTQPDKPKGRGKSMLPTPVKEEALKHGFPVYQPVKVRDPEFLQVLEKLDPDIIVVAAFGQIIHKRNTDVLTSMHPCFRNTAVQLLFSRQLLMGKRSQVLRS